MLIAQLSDTHVAAAGRQEQDLRAAIEYIGALVPRPDLIVISGDLVNGGRPDQYARLNGTLAGTRVPVYVVPGNHDRRAALRSALAPTYYPGVSGERLNYVVETGAVRVVALDTSDFRRPGGVLDAAALRWLDATLAGASGRPTFIFMHHPPFRTGVTLADVFGFVGLRSFAQLIARHRHVGRIVSGHIHCERQSTIGAALVTSSLSSTPQIVPELLERRAIGLRPEPAGFCLHEWRAGAFRSTTYVRTAAGFAVR